jgi:hypothetical protein
MKSKEKIPRIIKEEWNFDENGFKVGGKHILI